MRTDAERAGNGSGSNSGFRSGDRVFRPRLLAALLSAAVLVAAAACGGTASAPRTASGSAQAPPAGGKVLAFGGTFPLTGSGAVIGQAFERGINLAVAAVNGAGGVDGWRLKAVPVDNKGTAQGGVQAMNQLANLDHVPFALVTFSASILGSLPTATQDHVLMLNVGGPSNQLLNHAWLYNSQVMPGVLNPPLARYEWDQGRHTVAMLTRDDASGRGNSQSFAAAWQKLGGRILVHLTFAGAAPDVTAQLTQIRTLHPQVVYIYETGDNLGNIVKQARGLGITAPLIGPLATGGLITAGGKAANGFVEISVATDPKTTDSRAAAFYKAYDAKYHSTPTWIQGMGYEGVELLADLIRETVAAGGDPRQGSALLAALKAHPEYHNYLVGGNVRLLPDHGADRTLALHEVENGRFVTIKTVQPAS